MWPFLHPETVSQNSRPEWDAISACGPSGKPHPASTTNSGSHFPPRPSTGNRVPFPEQITGCSFRQAPQPETASHSKGKFWDALSETPSIPKARPTLNASSERMRACHPGRPRHRGDGKCRPKHLPRLHPRVSEKSLENFEAFTFVRLNARHRERRSTPPARPFWRLQPCCPDLPWWDGPSRQPSCRAAS